MLQQKLPSIDKLLQSCMVKLERIHIFTCDICPAVYVEEDRLIRHLYKHLNCEDTLLSSYDQTKTNKASTCVTSDKAIAADNSLHSKTQQLYASVRDRIMFESDSDGAPNDTESLEGNIVSFSSKSALSTNDNQPLKFKQITARSSSSQDGKEKSKLTSVTEKNVFNKRIEISTSCKIHMSKLTYQGHVTIDDDSCDCEQFVLQTGHEQEQIQTVQQYCCDICKKSFVSKRTLSTHVKLHSVVDNDNKKKPSGGITSDTLSTSDYQLFFDSNNDMCADTLNVEETVSNSSSEIAEEDVRNKENESTSNSVSAKHIINKSYGKLIPCNICNKQFAHVSFLKRHELTHQKEKIVILRDTEDCQDKQTQKVELYACDICQKEFSKKKYLTKHRNIHTLQKSWKCTFCARKFRYQLEMKRHQRIHTDDKPYSCNECNKFFRNYSSYSLHKRNVHTKDRPICGICDRIFSEKTALTRHILSVHMTKGYPCSICNKEFGHPKARASHMVIHKKTFMCSCGKCFQIKSDLMRHEALHQKAFQCHYCSMRFGKKYRLECHIRNSCKKVPKHEQKYFECKFCHMKTRSHNYLAIHSKTCKLKPYDCPKCRRRYANLSKLNSHQKRCERLNKNNVNK